MSGELDVKTAVICARCLAMPSSRYRFRWANSFYYPPHTTPPGGYLSAKMGSSIIAPSCEN
ncbi:MAG: hypothetical protein M5U34_28690 [Chloroflexi bacterium]|nr:hypothetical protein [Chloroflexota bacterium]